MYRFKSTIFSLAAITALVVVTADCKADATAIRRFIGSVDRERMSKHLFYLAKDPLPYRKLNLTLPGHEKNTLYEADDYLAGKLKTWGYHVEREGVQVQAFRRDASKPKHAQYSPPKPEDPWYTAYNLYAEKKGRSRPDKIIVVLAHKDSQSWIDSPGANDNAIGTVGVLEMACVLAKYTSESTFRFLFCNEEHTPWTSKTAAQKAKSRGDNIVAVFNMDGIGAKTAEETAAGKKTNVTVYTEPEGKHLAELMAEVNARYSIGLEQHTAERPRPGDDDGSFVLAGYPAAVINIGSFPYGDPNYHAEGDIPEACDIENAAMTVQATLAAVMAIDRDLLEVIPKPSEGGYPRQDDISSFVVVSQRDPRYFELSNGSSYIPIGFNLVGPPREEEFDRLFKIMADNKINYCRVWVSHNDWNVEHEKCLQFDPDRAKTIDRFLSRAHKNGIRVKMCLEYFRDIRPDRNRWSDNLIYHKVNKGPYESMHDYLSSDEGRSHFKAKLDWYANRYGDNPAVFAWELWNEMDAVRGSEWLDWTKEILPEFHSRFPRNLVVQSLGSYDWENKRQRYKTLCLLKDNHVAQVHRYLDEGAGWKICHGPVDILASQAVRELIAFNPGKPIILTETGAVKPRHTGCSELYAKDRDGILLHDMLFAPFFSGAAGTGHVWWWRQALDEPNLWYHFARFAEAVKDIDPPKEHFEPIMISENRYRLYVLKGRKTVLAWCRDSRNDWKNEFVLGHQPEILDSLKIDFTPFLTGSNQKQARVFDPWRNRWQDKSIESGRVKLDAFKRSVVIRVE